MVPSDRTLTGYLGPPPAAQQGYQSVLVSRADPSPSGETAERYGIDDHIGGAYEVRVILRGGMGVVYGAYHRGSRLPRALKTLQARFAADAFCPEQAEGEVAACFAERTRDAV
jgi:hypothetical protein